MGIYTATLLLGALIALVPDMPLVRLMVVSQFIDGVQLPIILIFIVLLVRDQTVMGEYASGRTLQAIQWATAIVLGAMSLLLLVMTA